MEDLFEDIDSLPVEVKLVLDRFSLCEGYEDCKNLQISLENIGYTCDYGLDGVPYELRKI